MTTLYKVAKVNSLSWCNLISLKKLKSTFSGSNAFMSFCGSIGCQKLAVTKILVKYPSLGLKTKQDIEDVLNALEKFHIDAKSAVSFPKIFRVHPMVIDNHGCTLLECGFSTIKVEHISRYNFLIKCSIQQLRQAKLLPHDDNIEARLLNILGKDETFISTLPRPLVTNTTSLLQLRSDIIRMFLMTEFGVSNEQMERIFKLYLKVLHQPLAYLKEMLHLLQDDIKMSNERILNNGYVLGGYPPNIRNMLEHHKTLAGIDIRWILQNFPTLVRVNWKTLEKHKKILQKHEITLLAQSRSLRIFSLSPETLDQRLTELKQYPDFKALFSHPQVLTLVIRKNKAVQRLRYLRLINKKCTTLFNFVTSDKDFESHCQAFGDRAGCIDSLYEITKVLYPVLKKQANEMFTNSGKTLGKRHFILKKELESYKEELNDGLEIDSSGGIKRKRMFKHQLNIVNRLVLYMLKKHVHWRYSSTVSVLEALYWLLQHFSMEDVFDQLYVILYPLPQLKHTIGILMAAREAHALQKNTDSPLTDKNVSELTEYFSGLDCSGLTDKQILTLALYALEVDCYFTGNGIWCSEDMSKDKFVEKKKVHS